MSQHGFHVERNAEWPIIAGFIYAWCSCGWFHEADPNTARDDYFKQAFLVHLRSLGTTARIDQP